MTNETLNIDLVRKAISKRPKYKKAIKMFADREKGRFEITFRQFGRVMNDDEKAPGWTKQEVSEFFDMLKEAGAGKTSYGGDTPRFLFHYHLQSFGRAVLGLDKADDIRKPAPPRRDRLPGPGDAPAFSSTNDTTPGVTDKRRLHSLLKDFVQEFDVSNMSPKAVRTFTDILLFLTESP